MVVVGHLDLERGVVVVPDPEQAEWLENNGYYGAKEGETFLLDGFEALLLFERRRLTLDSWNGDNFDAGSATNAGAASGRKRKAGELVGAGGSASEVMTESAPSPFFSPRFAELVAAFTNFDPDFWVKYCVYRDLRGRGYVVRGGFGGQVAFRVYKRGAKFPEAAAKFFVSVVVEGRPTPLFVLDSVTGHAIASRKVLILAVVDPVGEPTYYQVERHVF